MNKNETIVVGDWVTCPSVEKDMLFTVIGINEGRAQIRPDGALTSMTDRNASIEGLNKACPPTSATEPAKPEKPAKQPPMGIRSRQRMDEDRFAAIQEAIRRYQNEDYQVPPEWIEERKEILHRLNDYYGIDKLVAEYEPLLSGLEKLKQQIMLCGNACLNVKG